LKGWLIYCTEFINEGGQCLLDMQALYAIFDDKRHPFYDHGIAA